MSEKEAQELVNALTYEQLLLLSGFLAEIIGERRNSKDAAESTQ